MIWRPDPLIFQQKLGAWAIRGVCCAAPSFVWATMGEFKQPAHILAMVAGVATYVLAFAWATELPVYCTRVEPGDFGTALRLGANIRAAIAPLMFFGPDTVLGVGSLMVVEKTVRAFGVAQLSVQAGSFWLTYATTLTQGALVSVTMLVVVLLVWGVRALWKCHRGGNGFAAPG